MFVTKNDLNLYFWPRDLRVFLHSEKEVYELMNGSG